MSSGRWLREAVEYLAEHRKDVAIEKSIRSLGGRFLAVAKDGEPAGCLTFADREELTTYLVEIGGNDRKGLDVIDLKDSSRVTYTIKVRFERKRNAEATA